MNEDNSATIARRTLLGAVGVSTIAGLTAGVLGLTGRAASPTRLAAATSTAAPTAIHTATHTPAASAAAQMDHDAQAEAAVKAFPAKTKGAGLAELPSRVVDGVREFDITT